MKNTSGSDDQTHSTTRLKGKLYFNMNLVQGGEKNIMKKISSVALSAALAFALFPQQQSSAHEVKKASAPKLELKVPAAKALEVKAPQAAPVVEAPVVDKETQEQYNAMKAKGFFKGTVKGDDLQGPVKRDQVAALLGRVLEIAKAPVAAPSYADVDAKNWAYEAIEAATKAGLFTGSPAPGGGMNFSPLQDITNEEMVAVFLRAMKIDVTDKKYDASKVTLTSQPTEWAKNAVVAAVTEGFAPAGANWQAVVSRGDFAKFIYKLDAHRQVKVDSYKVEDEGKTVVIKMVGTEEEKDRTVKVDLKDKPLALNEEREITFTYKAKEMKHKVKYEVSSAQGIKGVQAENVKQVVVSFDGAVDSSTAMNTTNYTIDGMEIKMAVLSDDEKSVTLTLEDKDKLIPSNEYTVRIHDIKGKDGVTNVVDAMGAKKTFRCTNSAAHAVKEVTALGTKAIQIKFSQPVDRDSADNGSNYKIEGEGFSGDFNGDVVYQYPDTVILRTNLKADQEYSVLVKNIKTMNDTYIYSSSTKFKAAAADTAAPEVKSIASIGVNQAVVTFNKPVQSVQAYLHSDYHNEKATTQCYGNKAFLKFNDSSMHVGENTLNLQNVRDFSGNVTSMTKQFTHKVQSSRPIILEDHRKLAIDGKSVTFKFNRDMNEKTVTEPKNYRLVDRDGQTVDSSVCEIVKNGISYNASTKEATVQFSSSVIDQNYRLEVRNVRQDGYNNYMNLQTIKLDGVHNNLTATINGKDLIITFPCAVKMDADNALRATNYAVDGKVLINSGAVNAVKRVDERTVKISMNDMTNHFKNAQDFSKKELTVSNVKDARGEYLNKHHGQVITFTFAEVQLDKAVLKENIVAELAKLTALTALTDTSTPEDINKQLYLAEHASNVAKAANDRLESQNKVSLITTSLSTANSNKTSKNVNAAVADARTNLNAVTTAIDN